ncbi:ATP-binding protein [Cerasicoccus fimbriatus]|uniref:ATP-binding protein n=1 Tax=Cerasicoccus fimbriatus TaxID=3014554 RepID=UPI0022B4FDFD|nr:ATP-binding protein [Cerasicoccus sp. TK19100]
MMRFFLLMAVFCWLTSVHMQAEVPSVETNSNQTQSPPLRVLVLYSNQRTLPANQDFQNGLWASLEGAINTHRIELFEEYLEIHRLPLEDDEPIMVSYLRERYADLKPDVVVSVGGQALDFSSHWMANVIPEAIEIFAAVREDQLMAVEQNKPFVGVLNVVQVVPLLEVASSMLPATKEIVLVGGSAPYDRALMRVARQNIQEAFPWEIREIIAASPDAIAAELSQLSPETIVLYTTFFKDSAGVTYIPKRVLERISKDSAVPIFALFDTMLGSGATGIAATPFDEQGRSLGSVLERIAQGETPSEIGLVSASAPRYLFDARAMRRYGMDPGAVPDEVEIFFEQPSLIQAHPVAFTVAVVTILVQASLIAALLWTRYRKKRAEQQASEMERYFSTVFRESPNPMAVIEAPSGLLRDINPAWEALYGFKRDEVIGRSPVELGILPDEQDRSHYEDFIDRSNSLSGYERQIRTGGGDLLNVAIYSNAVEKNGTRLQIVTTIDMSDRAEADRLRNNLARDNRLAQLGQISAWIAHEINQPLGAILSNAEAALICLSKGPDSRAELEEILKDIRSEERRASRVVEQIRKMLGKSSADMRVLSVSEYLEEVMRMAMPQATRQGVDLRLDLSELGEACVHGDRVLLMQVLLNLIFNAMDAVAVQPLSGRLVSVGGRIWEDRGELEIEVSDEGPGVPADRMDSIFNYYYTTKAEGMGVGLAISRFIIDEHKGALTVENRQSGGACFRVRLPLCKNAS